MADSVLRLLADRSLALDALTETGNPFTDDKINGLRKKQLLGSSFDTGYVYYMRYGLKIGDIQGFFKGKLICARHVRVVCPVSVNMTKVVFPCDQETWWQVKGGLHTLKQLCEQGNTDLKTVAIEHQSIINISTGIGDYGSLEYKQTVFYPLAQFFTSKATATEREHFLRETLPAIIDLALKVESLLPTEGIAVSEQQNAETRLLERQLCCSILACAFLCLIPDTHRPQLGRTINFAKFFSFLKISSQMAKLRCILNFFDRMSEEYSKLEGNISFTRLVIKKEELPTLDTWLNSTSSLCDLSVLHEGVIEDSCPEAVEVDFANRYIGGGTIGKGRVQEEIRFMVCPELIMSMLFMESMEDNEAIIIKGYEQFSKTGGYASGLMFVSDHKDHCQRDVDGFLKNTLCAIDAVSYTNKEGVSLGTQYLDQYVLRDLNKAFVGFSTPFIIPEGQSDKHIAEEDYYTADEEDLNKHYQTVAIDQFVDNLLRQAITLALPEALNNQVVDNGSRDKQESNPSGQPALQTNDEVHMNHLDVNFRDWYAHYRRRSSNLSDLSSRRSSWDVTSRRSSGCSLRGYSSEFSSEFEEYYDNFQSQDQKYKYHTIKEEVGTSWIHDFASSLATSLLKECTNEASQVDNGSGIQEFDDSRPADVENPQPHRLNTLTESVVVFLPSGSSDEMSIRCFVDNLFETVWPFGSKVECNSDTRRIVLSEILSKSIRDDNSDRNSNAIIYKDVDNLSEEHLYSVADSIVSQALDEALTEYRYRYFNPAFQPFEAQLSVESTQSDHSIGNKDQSFSTEKAQPFQAHSQSDSSSVPNPAVTVAERVMSKLFDTQTNQSISDVDNEKLSCDTTQASQPLHSLNGNQSDKTSNIYDKIADRLISRGFSSANSRNNHCKKSVGSSSSSQTSDRAPVSCLTDHYQFCDMLGNHPSYMHSALTCDSGPSQYDFSNYNSHPYRYRKSGKGSASVKSRSSSRRSKYSSDRVYSSSQQSDDKCVKMNLSESSNPNTSDYDRPSSTSTSNSGMEERQVPGRRSDKSHNISNKGIHNKTTKVDRGDNLQCGFHKHNHHVVGGKKNYDQFANCLSRDLLTNAFLQVQEHHEPVVHPRRSSEPLQISDGAALQRLENSVQSLNGKGSQKSRTVEDIGPFEEAWSNELECYQRTATGFRDPVLSKFAEELMKANVSVPTLDLLSDCVSTSGSSRSVCSTISSFRDPLLASFEDELLNTNVNRGIGSFRTQISWSKMKGSMCSPRQNESRNKNGYGKQRMNSVSIESELSGTSSKCVSHNSSPVCSEQVSGFADMLARRIVCEALKATVCHIPGSSRTEFSLEMYGDMLAADILSAAVLLACERYTDLLEQSKMVTWSDETHCQEYGRVIPELLIAPIAATTENGRSSSTSLETGSSCVEYEDALDFPYTRLEEYAEHLALKVLRNSVSITKREQTAALRKQYGRPISTGNWGCGAFGGDPHLKSLIQWLAASYAGTPAMIYYTFNHPKMEKFQDVIETVQKRGWDVSQLTQAIRRYCITAESEIKATGSVSKDLFTVILQGEVFPGL